MHTLLTPPADAFQDLPAAQALSCGITAHVVDPFRLKQARAYRYRRHDEIAVARHTGWYADCHQHELLTGYVYAFDGNPACLDDDAAATYYAMVESNDTDLHYLDPDPYDDPLEAAFAADRMAELLAELERDCDRMRDHAAQARGELAEGNRLRGEAFAILRHVRACPTDGDGLGPVFARLYDDAQAARRRGFELIEEHRPLPCSAAPDADRPPSRDACLADAWRDGWECARQP